MTNKNKNMIYILPIRCVIFAFIFIIGSIITKQKVEEISNWWSVVASIVNVVTIVIIIYLARSNKSTYWELINYQKGTTIRHIIGISILVLLVGIIGMYIAGYICYGVIPYAAPMMIAPIPIWLAIANLFILPITTSIAEDGLYLGCGVNQIDNKYLAIIFPAFFFALQHSFIPTLFDFRYIIYRFISFLPLTLILCWYYYKHKNPLPIMIGHTIIDIATVMQILATSAIPGLYEMICGI